MALVSPRCLFLNSNREIRTFKQRIYHTTTSESLLRPILFNGLILA